MTAAVLITAPAYGNNCSTVAPIAPFSMDSYLDVSFHPSYDKQHPAKESLSTDMIAYGPNEILGIKIPIVSESSSLSPLADFSISGKWWNLIGELAANPGITWRYKDNFAIDYEGKTYRLERSQLKKHPDLEKRFQAAKPSFDLIEISAYGVYDLQKSWTLRDPKLKFTILSNDVIVPNENQPPYRVPMSPPKWQDRLQVKDIKDQELKDKALIDEWKKIKGIRCPSIGIYGLKVPTATLAGIAKDLQNYQKEDETLDNLITKTGKDYKPKSSQPAYNGSEKYLEPVVFAVKGAEVKKGKDGEIALVAKAEGNSSEYPVTLFTTKSYEWASKIDNEGNNFIFAKSNGEQHILNATGQRVSIAGLDTFYEIIKEDTLRLYDQKLSPENLVHTTRNFYYRPPKPIPSQDLESFKITDVKPRCAPRAASNGENYVSLAAPSYRYDLHRLRKIEVDTSLNILSDNILVISGKGYRIGNGEGTCTP